MTMPDSTMRTTWGDESPSTRTTERLRLLVALASIGLLTACSGSDESASDTTQDSVDTTVVAVAEDTTTGTEADEPEADKPTTNGRLSAADATPIAASAETNGLNGIFVSPVDGTVYVAAVGGDELTIHDPETGELLERLGPESGVNAPDDVFITDDGTIYWTEILNGHVGMMTPDGETKRQLVGPGVNPITVSDDGRLFVGRIFVGAGLYELDPNLEAEPVLLIEDPGINAFDFGPDGFLYAPSWFTGEIVRIDVDAATPVPEVVASGFTQPSSAKFDAAGELYMSDFATGEVWKLDLEGGEHELIVDIEGTIDNIAFDSDDRLFIAAGADNQIIRYDDGRIDVLGEFGIGQPGGVAVSADGTVWVADFSAIHGFTPGERQPTTSIYDVSGATVAIDGDNLIAASVAENSVQIIDPATGEILQDIQTLALPTNAIRHGEMLVASQAGAGNVVNAEDPTEVLLDTVVGPLGMASDGTTLYVGDFFMGNIWAVGADGATLLASELISPEGMAVDGDRLLVAEPTLKRITAIDLATGAKSVVIDGLDYSDRIPQDYVPFGMVASIAVGSDGTIYVSDDGVNQVYAFTR